MAKALNKKQHEKNRIFDLTENIFNAITELDAEDFLENAEKLGLKCSGNTVSGPTSKVLKNLDGYTVKQFFDIKASEINEHDYETIESRDSDDQVFDLSRSEDDEATKLIEFATTVNDTLNKKVFPLKAKYGLKTRY